VPLTCMPHKPIIKTRDKDVTEFHNTIKRIKAHETVRHLLETIRDLRQAIDKNRHNHEWRDAARELMVFLPNRKAQEPKEIVSSV
jgi:hypothetical protein